MTWLRTLRIRTKLLGAFALVITIAVAIGGVSYVQTARIGETSDQISEDYLPGLGAAVDILDNLSGFREAQLQNDAAHVREHGAELAKAVAAYESTVADAEERALFATFKSAYDAFVAESTGKLAVEATYDRAVESLQALVHFNEQRGAAAGRDTRARIDASRRWTLLLLIGGALLAAAIAFGVARAIDRPVRELRAAANAIAHGELDHPLSYRGEDELGALADAFRASSGALESVVGELQQLIDASGSGRLGARGDAARFEGAYAALVSGMNTVLDNLGEPIRYVAENTDALASAAEELTAVAQQLGANAGETSSKLTMVAAAAEQVSRSSQSLSTATDEMSVSIRDIAKHAGESARVAGEAVKMAEHTNGTVSKLGESAQAIGRVIKVITSIAQQTNLLALNATIEAARAGEAGKGFAVVANEVKELAKETAKATEDIGRSVESIQSDTEEAVGAIGTIGGIIGQINDMSTAIAGAVEQQSATTTEMGRNVGETAKGAGDIAQNITTVTEVAHHTSSGAGQTQTSAAELSRMAAELRKLTARFTFAA